MTNPDVDTVYEVFAKARQGTGTQLAATGIGAVGGGMGASAGYKPLANKVQGTYIKAKFKGRRNHVKGVLGNDPKLQALGVRQVGRADALGSVNHALHGPGGKAGLVTAGAIGGAALAAHLTKPKQPTQFGKVSPEVKHDAKIGALALGGANAVTGLAAPKYLAQGVIGGAALGGVGGAAVGAARAHNKRKAAAIKKPKAVE